MWTPRHETGRDGRHPWSGGRTTWVAAAATAPIRQPLAPLGTGSSGLGRAFLDLVCELVAAQCRQPTAGRDVTAVRADVQALVGSSGISLLR